MIGAKRTTYRTIPGIDAAPRTDLPVLLPVAEITRRKALIERREGTYRLNLEPRHALWMAALFVLVAGVAQAAAAPGLPGPFEALVKWMPFVVLGAASMPGIVR